MTCIASNLAKYLSIRNDGCTYIASYNLIVVASVVPKRLVLILGLQYYLLFYVGVVIP